MYRYAHGRRLTFRVVRFEAAPSHVEVQPMYIYMNMYACIQIDIDLYIYKQIYINTDIYIDKDIDISIKI